MRRRPEPHLLRLPTNSNFFLTALPRQGNLFYNTTQPVIPGYTALKRRETKAPVVTLWDGDGGWGCYKVLRNSVNSPRLTS